MELDSFPSPLIPLLCNHAVLSLGSNGVTPNLSSYCLVTAVCVFFPPLTHCTDSIVACLRRELKTGYKRADKSI